MNIFKKILGVIVAGAFVAGGWFIVKGDKDHASQPVPQPRPARQNQQAQAPASPSMAASVSKSGTQYRDGSYSAVGQYDSPAGTEQVSVSVAIKGDTITSATVTADSGNRRSQKYQSMFISGFKQYVVGKPVDSVNLDVVSGSSLTPEGFNNALATIKQQAKA